MTEHDRIWLEPAPGADEEYGRQWCQDNVWDDGVEYVLADTVSSLTVERDRLREENRAYKVLLERAQAIISTKTYPKWHEAAGAALSPVEESKP